MKEQRRYIRYSAEGNINLKLEDGTLRSVKADLQNISYLGISACTSEKIEEGIQVAFELTTKSWDEPIIGRGRIKNIQEIKKIDSIIFRLGIEFIEVDKGTIKCIINRIVEDFCQAVRQKRP